LLVKRRNEPLRGMLVVPGGSVNEGEREDAALRKLKEETSLDFELDNILSVYSYPTLIEILGNIQ